MTDATEKECWRMLLMHLGKSLQTDDVAALKFLSNLDFNAKSINTGNEVLFTLDELGKISMDNLLSLLNMLDKIKRSDLTMRVKDYGEKKKKREQSRRSQDQNRPVLETIGVAEKHMKESPCGICLIISNETFGKLEKRTGTHVDEKSLEETFEWLDFNVDIQRNLTAREMCDKLLEVAKMNHEKYDAFVCCILTHGGSNEKLYGTDNEPLTVTDIKSIFADKKCPSLKEKPKIFLLQACRGKDSDSGLICSPTDEKEKNVSTKTPTESEENQILPPVDDDLQSCDCDLAQGDLSTKDYKGELTSNFLFYFPSAPGKKSILHHHEGSWLISTLCTILKKHAQEMPLRHMLKKVTGKVSKKTSTLCGGFKANPELAHNLEYSAIFFRKTSSWEEYSTNKAALSSTSGKE